jgi:type IV fimbrial biogenesis protein FimT
MVTIAIIAILAGFAAPAFSNWLQRMEANQFYPQMRFTLAQGRQMAASGVFQVVICGATAGSASCDGKWTQGILTFYDLNSNEKFEPATDKVISHTNLNIKYGRVFVKAALSKKVMVFKPNTGNALGFNGAVYYCGGEATLHRALILRGEAQMRMSPDNNKDGIMEDADGDPLTDHCL